MAFATPPPPRPDRLAAPVPALRTRSGSLSFDRVVLVGVLNATPDSFSDGGLHLDPVRAATTAAAMVEAGAGMLDLGAESTRPGAAPVPAEEELRRLLPVLRAVRAAVRVPLSIDTRKAVVATAALDAGADVVNDVSAGRDDPAMLSLCARTGVPIVLMHMRGTPATMQDAPAYADVVGEVRDFLATRATVALAAGVAADAIVIDPGIGFGKTCAHNVALLRGLDLVAGLGYPVLVGVSRKGFVGELLGGVAPTRRGFGTAAAVALAVAHGARLVRVHDVRAMRDVVTVAEAIARA
ncbi:MAG: dihydropteroate synthase [Candidatus Binatia bacterium]